MNVKRTLLSGLALSLLWSLNPAQALPTGAAVTNGGVQIKTQGNVMQVLQSTHQAIVNWNGFNINVHELVQFLQPNQMAIILNRVTGQDPSVILGALKANGQVYLLNPNGILFGPGSTVDTGSFVASTLSMSDQDFLNKNFHLVQDPSKVLGSIVSQGTIKVADGGYLVLSAPSVLNEGLVVANRGQVAMGSSTESTISFDPSGNLQFVVPQSAETQGQGVVTQGQMSDVMSRVINPGVPEAKSLGATANKALLLTNNGGTPQVTIVLVSNQSGQNLAAAANATLTQQTAQSNINLGQVPSSTLTITGIGTLPGANPGLTSSSFVGVYTLSLGNVIDEKLLDNFWRTFLEGTILWEGDENP